MHWIKTTSLLFLSTKIAEAPGTLILSTILLPFKSPAVSDFSLIDLYEAEFIASVVDFLAI